MRYCYQERCDSCGKFISLGAPGVSWSQDWQWSWGEPDLNDPTYRCNDCTEKLGIKPTNCQETETVKYHGRNPTLING